MEVRELLSLYKFPGDDTPIVIGSALKALEGTRARSGYRRGELVEEMDRYIPIPSGKWRSRPDAGGGCVSISGRGTVVRGVSSAGSPR